MDFRFIDGGESEKISRCCKMRR